MKPKALVAMSGGVDSSVAAALMKDAGYDVVGLMMKLWKGEAANNESGCCSVDAAEDARRVAQVLDIPFYVQNFADAFSRTVIANFIDEYSRGRTPNPCVQCNRSVKFSILLERAKAYGASFVATGHYARIDNRGHLRLLRGIHRDKDQSYVLYMLGQDELSHARFPVGEYSKDEVRGIASSLGLRTADKPESQEICFVPGGDTRSFLSEMVPAGSQPGPVITSRGERIGTHRGFAHYTIGQRKGLGVSVGTPLYVREVRPHDNAVVVDRGDRIHCDELIVDDVGFVSGERPDSVEATVMTRYRGPETAATIKRTDTSYRVMFEEPAGPTAPGQAAVFYKEEEVVGGGTIARVS